MVEPSMSAVHTLSALDAQIAALRRQERRDSYHNNRRDDGNDGDNIDLSGSVAANMSGDEKSEKGMRDVGNESDGGDDASQACEADEASQACGRAGKRPRTYEDADVREQRKSELQARREEFEATMSPEDLVKLRQRMKAIHHHERRGYASLCYMYLATGVWTLGDGRLFRQAGSLTRLTDDDRAAIVKECRAKRTFDASFAKNLTVPLNVAKCWQFTKFGRCDALDCRFWHIGSELSALYAGCSGFCRSCRVGFKGRDQEVAHYSSEKHKAKHEAHQTWREKNSKGHHKGHYW